MVLSVFMLEELLSLSKLTLENRMRFTKTVMVVCVVCCLVSSAYGHDRRRPPVASVPQEDTTTTTSYDYGDAPQAYGSTYNQYGTWQYLGDGTIEESWSGESSSKYVDQDDTDDGVVWSTDGGTTWGHDEVRVGQTVIFKFTMTRAGYGNHEYDQLKAWIDWDGDYSWDYSAGSEEEIIAVQWFKDEDVDGVRHGFDSAESTQIDDTEYWNYVNSHAGDVPNPDADLVREYTVTLIIPEDALIGETWLRARVSCDHTSFADTTPYNNLYQGETEDYLLKIVAVPVPSAILLVGTGLLGVRRMRRRFNRA